MAKSSRTPKKTNKAFRGLMDPPLTWLHLATGMKVLVVYTFTLLKGFSQGTVELMPLGSTDKDPSLGFDGVKISTIPNNI